MISLFYVMPVYDDEVRRHPRDLRTRGVEGRQSVQDRNIKVSAALPGEPCAADTANRTVRRIEASTQLVAGLRWELRERAAE
jgi:hypothetical protein